MNTIKLFKNGRKIIGYIKQTSKGFSFCTGKPSDINCLSWKYDNYEQALKTGNEYFKNYTL